jgi:ABC-type thiamin/hydroxymethylpyrimidine transport system permease subunit
MRSYTVRDWVTIGLFGALWGVVELTLGSLLHAIYPPLADTFLTGVVLGGIGVTVALTGRHFAPKRGSVVLIGIVTALLELLGPGENKIGPMAAILLEGALMEMVLWIVRAPRQPALSRAEGWAFVLGGALAVAWNLPHKFLMMRLLYGKGVVEVYTKMVQEGSQALGLDPSAALLILAILLLIRLAVGALGGWGAWKLGGAVARRLGRRALPADEGER